jgi:hypothetical protein
MEQPMDAGQEPGAGMPFGFAQTITGEKVEFGPGFAASINAQQDMVMAQAGTLVANVSGDLDLQYGGALVTNIGGDAAITNGGASVMNIGGDTRLANGGAAWMNIGGNVDLNNAGVGVTVSREAKAENSVVMVNISGQTTLGEGSRVLLNTTQAAVFGAAFGVVYALLRWVLRK